jgi:hypothetical protein
MGYDPIIELDAGVSALEFADFKGRGGAIGDV